MVGFGVLVTQYLMPSILTEMERGKRKRMKIKNYIKSYENFPKKGITFYDTIGLCAEPAGFQLTNNFITENLLKYTSESYTDKIIGIDARGFIFASPLAHNSTIPLILARKEGKLPGPVISRTYDLEYGTSTIQIQKDSINNKDRVIIIDDLCATGGTIQATIDIVESVSAKVVAVLCVVDLPELGGSAKIKERNIPFYNAVSY